MVVPLIPPTIGHSPWKSMALATTLATSCTVVRVMALSSPLSSKIALRLLKSNGSSSDEYGWSNCKDKRSSSRISLVERVYIQEPTREIFVSGYVVYLRSSVTYFPAFIYFLKVSTDFCLVRIPTEMLQSGSTRGQQVKII